MTTIPTTFRELARVNTGAHFLDSGSAYGRHHERGAIPADQPLEYARGGYTAPVVAQGNLEEVLCAIRIRPYCHRCQDDPDTLYAAEKRGWRCRVNRRSVSLVCGTCKRSAMCFPMEEEAA